MKVVALVFVSVCINFVASITMNYAAKQQALFVALVFIGIAIALNLLRFAYWGTILKRYDLSHAYPITALFFPLIYFYSVYFEKMAFHPVKLLAVAFIILGVIVLNKKEKA